MKSGVQKQREFRSRQRERGYILKHLWVKAAWWPQVQKYIRRLTK